MKKLLGLALMLGLVSQAAHASQARLLALGLDKLDNEGSYYIDDSRNIFLNAANAYDYADMVMFEWGGSGVDVGNLAGFPTDDGTTVDTDDNPKGQGGFLTQVGDYVFGAYFGNESNIFSFLRIAATSNGALVDSVMLPTADNQLDLFFAGKTASDMRWGVNLVYLDNDNETANQEDKAGAIRFGVKTDRWQAHANVSFMNEAENTYEDGGGDEVVQKFDGSLGLHIGGGYKLNERDTLYAYYKTFTWDQIDDGETSEGKFNTLNLGWGHAHQMDNGGTYFVNAYFRMIDIELDFADSGVDTAELDVKMIPLTFGYEQRATNWLTLRGSITQNLYGTKENKNYAGINAVATGLIEDEFGTEGKGSLSNSTQVRAGASLNFGNLNIDGLLGMEAGDMTDTLSMDEVFSRVGVTYSF